MSEGTMVRDGHETWYSIVGDLDAGPTPVVICHGGPGAAHDYTEPIANLSRYGRGCVLYDQVGCGKSTHLPDAPADFWTVQLFKDELADLTRKLGIAERYAVVGQSWGGMLAMEHALDHPPGLRAVVVADSPASMPLWVEEANRLRAGLPPEVQETLTQHEERERRTQASTTTRCASTTTATCAAFPGPAMSNAASTRSRKTRPSTTR